MRILLIIPFLLGCAGSLRTPDWVTDKDAVYPPGKYLAEVGEGGSLKDAKANAVGSIAQIFKTEITVDSSIRTRYTEITSADGSEVEQQTDYDKTIGQRAGQTLFNLKYGESWQDDQGRVYVISYLDRAETGNIYRKNIAQNDKRIMELLERANIQNEPFKRFAFLDAAIVLIKVNAELKGQLEIINSLMAKTIIHPYKAGDVQAELSDQASAVTVQVEVSGGSGETVLSELKDWLTEKGFTVSNKGLMLLTASVSMNSVELDNGYENYNWKVDFVFKDRSGFPLISLPKQGRSSGISVSAAEARAFQDITKLIREDFNNDFLSYLNSFLGK